MPIPSTQSALNLPQAISNDCTMTPDPPHVTLGSIYDPGQTNLPSRDGRLLACWQCRARKVIGLLPYSASGTNTCPRSSVTDVYRDVSAAHG